MGDDGYESLIGPLLVRPALEHSQLERIGKLRASGFTQRETAVILGVHVKTVCLHEPRSEAEIRADLARQLERIDRRFRLALIADRMAEPIA